MQTFYAFFFILLSGFSAILSVYVRKAKGASAFSLGFSLLLAMFAWATTFYELTSVLFNIILLAWAAGLIGTMYLIVRKVRVFALLAIPLTLSIRVFIFVDVLFYLSGLTLFLGIWNSFDYSGVKIKYSSDSLREKLILGPFSWLDGILRSRLKTKQLRRAIFLSDTGLSAAFVLAPLGIYLLFGFRIVTDVLLIGGIIFFSMGRQQYLRHRGRSGH